MGVDIVEISRIQAVWDRKPSFAQRILTQRELAYFEKVTGRRKIEFLAGRFAGKEAYSKALGTGLGRLSFKDIEILINDQGQPVLTSHPKAGRALISISHTRDLCLAQVLLQEVWEWEAGLFMFFHPSELVNWMAWYVNKVW